MLKNLLLTSLFLSLFANFSIVSARVTPEDILESKKDAYQKTVASYSPASKLKLEELSKSISELNKTRTDHLNQLMLTQGEILDEYIKRGGDETSEEVEDARYWITFAHEAIAYQAAKVYVFNLTSEKNLKSDILGTINIFRNELEYAKSTAIKSQKILGGIL